MVVVNSRLFQHKEWEHGAASITTKCLGPGQIINKFRRSKRPDRDHDRQRLRRGVRARAEYMLMPTEYYRTSVPGRHKSMYVWKDR